MADTFAIIEPPYLPSENINNTTNANHDISRAIWYLRAHALAIRKENLAFSILRFATLSLWSKSTIIAWASISLFFTIAASASSLVNFAMTIGTVSTPRLHGMPSNHLKDLQCSSLPYILNKAGKYMSWWAYQL